MGMPAMLPHRWTAEEVLAIPESPGYRFEAVDGALIVSPSPSFRHQRAVTILASWLTSYAESSRCGVVLCAPFDIVPDKGTVTQPDVLVLPLVDDRVPDGWAESARLLLAVEVLSPTSVRQDRYLKRRKYQEMGAVTWIVDLDAQQVEVWLPGKAEPHVCAGALEWAPVAERTPLVLDLQRFFRKVDGKEL